MINLSIPVVDPPKPDDKANQEANSFANGSYEEEEKRNEHGRKERLRKHISDAVLVLFWIAVIGVACMGTIWLYHMLLPAAAHFLSDDQVNRIQNMLFSGIVATALPNYLKKYI